MRRRVTSVGVVLIAAASLCSAQQAPRVVATIDTPPRISEQPMIRAIYEWGGSIAVITEKWLPSKERYTYQLATVNRVKSRLVVFKGVPCDAYYDVGYTEALGQVVVCGRGGSAQVVHRTVRSWSPLADPVEGHEFRCAVDGDRIALISERAIYLITGASMRLLAQVPTDDKNFSRPPSAMLLSGSALWIGYDHGEFGGGLYRLDINQSSPVLMHMLDDRVRFLAKSKAGRIWAAAGISHLGGVDGAVYRIGDDGSPQSVASISGYGDYQGGRSKIEEQSGVPFPGLSAVAGLAFTSDDDPIVVLPEFGVFALETDHFEALYRGTLEFFYNQKFRHITAGVMSAPIGVVRASDDLFIASRSLGVLLLTSNSRESWLKQILFEAPSNKRR